MRIRYEREQTLRDQQTRLQNHMDRMVTAYPEELITLAELRERVPALRKQAQAIESELRSLEMASEDKARYLRLVETLSQFRDKLRVRAETLETKERQKIIRLIVQEILVGADTIRIRHSIPMAEYAPRGIGSAGSTAISHAGPSGSYPLRTGSPEYRYGRCGVPISVPAGNHRFDWARNVAGFPPWIFHFFEKTPSLSLTG